MGMKRTPLQQRIARLVKMLGARAKYYRAHRRTDPDRYAGIEQATRWAKEDLKELLRQPEGGRE